VYTFLQWVEREQSKRRLDRGVDFLVVGVVLQKSRHRIDGELGVAVALSHDPLFERLFAKREPLEQVSGVQLRCSSQRLRLALADELFELHGVDIDRGEVESDVIALEHERRRGNRRESLLEAQDRLAQAMPRVFFCRVAPEKPGEFFTRLWLIRVEREVGEQSLGFAGGKSHRHAGRQPRAKSAQQSQIQPFHLSLRREATCGPWSRPAPSYFVVPPAVIRSSPVTAPSTAFPGPVSVLLVTSA
jgi:hypothetical protein